MNKVILMGRPTRDPDIRYSQGGMAVARYTLAVDRRFSRSNENGNDQTADFISCVAFGRSAEFAEKYLHQGIKIAVTGRIQTGSYTNRDGQKVYTTEVIVDDQEFADSKDVYKRQALGKSGPKARLRSVADGEQVENPVPQGIRTAGTQKGRMTRECKDRGKRGRSTEGKAAVQNPKT